LHSPGRWLWQEALCCLARRGHCAALQLHFPHTAQVMCGGCSAPPSAAKPANQCASVCVPGDTADQAGLALKRAVHAGAAPARRSGERGHLHGGPRTLAAREAGSSLHCRSQAPKGGACCLRGAHARCAARDLRRARTPAAADNGAGYRGGPAPRERARLASAAGEGA